MPFVFPPGKIAAQLTRGNHIDGSPGDIRQIADKAAFTQIPVPYLGTELVQTPGGLADLLIWLAGSEDLPGGEVGGEDGI